jgi:lipopolysaccharide export system protein LptA
MTRWMAVAALGIWLLGLGPSVGEAQTRRRQPADATKSETAAKPTAPKVAAAPPAPAPKRSANPAQPVDVEADRLESNQKEGLVIFTGNVVARHNNSTQYADRMEVYLDDGGDRVLRTVSTGTVRIITRNCRTGTAQRVEYYDAEQKVILIGDARVWEDENVVTGERITIFIAEDRSLVEAGAQGRVKGVFYPRREGEAAAGRPAAGAPCKEQ